IKKNTRRFSKRQLTWFKRNEATKWFDYATNKKEIIEYVENSLK
ncbi:MAG: tRNA (adenosine(37)-N6)-dimethylallyltransferase MiaA, partial [Flavobacterium sp.]